MMYPTSYVDGDSGKWSVIFQGHGLAIADILPVVVEHLGEPDMDDVLNVSEVWLRYQPRVKWCSNHNGWGCDQEGEWHGHWIEVRASTAAPEARFTLATFSPETHDSGSNRG